ncbi:MAG TPA: sodium-dependent transporter [Victivallales bacterium]|nr:sodium-dependent transporter [Victivallales bacterium]
MKKRETWNSQTGFILASLGAAIGLGNLWLFPWRFATYGGGSFLIPYLIFLFIFVRLGLTAEIAFGRACKKGPVGSFKKVMPEKYRKIPSVLGTLPGIALFCILSFYLVVSGWIASYIYIYIFKSSTLNHSTNFFNSFAGSSYTIPGLIIVLALISITLIFGINKGIEKCNSIAMPLFFIMLIILLVGSMSLGSSTKTFKYMFTFSWDQLLNINTWVMALGQSFFTVCLGGMLTYGSYLKRDTNIPKAAFLTALFNMVASLLATLVIIPAVFSFNLNMNSGPALLFLTIPKICSMFTGGFYFGLLFFIAAFLAALSSAINLMEVAVETLINLFKISRMISVFIITVLLFIISAVLTLHMGLFTNWTNLVSIYFYPIMSILE